MYEYFVSYSFGTVGDTGFGNCSIKVDEKINNIEAVREVTRTIEKQENWPERYVSIINFFLLDDH